MQELALGYFLSHLCGEEDIAGRHTVLIDFLSHLCGEEVAVVFSVAYGVFLSHLCGEEEVSSLSLTTFTLSKSPMR